MNKTTVRKQKLFTRKRSWIRRKKEKWSVKRSLPHSRCPCLGKWYSEMIWLCDFVVVHFLLKMINMIKMLYLLKIITPKSHLTISKNVKAVEGPQWGSTGPFFPVFFWTGWGEMEVYMKCIYWLWGWFNAPGLTFLGKYFLLVDTT